MCKGCFINDIHSINIDLGRLWVVYLGSRKSNLFSKHSNFKSIIEGSLNIETKTHQRHLLTVHLYF